MMMTSSSTRPNGDNHDSNNRQGDVETLSADVVVVSNTRTPVSSTPAAVVADNHDDGGVVNATIENCTLPATRDENSDEATGVTKWKKKYGLVSFLILSVVFVGIGLAIALTPRRTRSDDNDGATTDGEKTGGGGAVLSPAMYQQRFVQIKSILTRYSDPTIFTDASSPQSKALGWLVTKDETIPITKTTTTQASVDLNNGGDVVPNNASQTTFDSEGDLLVKRILQRYTMMVLFYACSGEDWPGLLTPLDEQYNVNECGFLGVTCNHLGMIVGLDLSLQRLAGLLPAEIAILTNLEYLDLSNNFLEGSVPHDLYKLTNLDVLYLAANGFTSTISPEIGKLTSLTALELDMNHFTGSLPAKMSQLTNLEYVIINHNDFTGPILDLALHWPRLIDFNIASTQITGTIPESIGDILTDLRGLSMTRTFLSGSLPSSFTKMTLLDHLGLYSQRFNSIIPTDIWKLSNLNEFMFLAGFRGTVPSEIGKLTLLEQLFFGYNTLNGTLPSELGNLVALKEIAIESTQITGGIPSEFANLANLTYISVIGNHLSGSADPLCHVDRVLYDCQMSCSCCANDCQGCPVKDKRGCDSDEYKGSIRDENANIREGGS